MGRKRFSQRSKTSLYEDHIDPFVDEILPVQSGRPYRPLTVPVYRLYEAYCQAFKKRPTSTKVFHFFFIFFHFFHFFFIFFHFFSVEAINVKLLPSLNILGDSEPRIFSKSARLGPACSSWRTPSRKKISRCCGKWLYSDQTIKRKHRKPREKSKGQPMQHMPPAKTWSYLSWS